MSKYTAQDLDTLRRQAQEIEKVLAAEKNAKEREYTAQQAALEQQREKELRQAYVRQQQALAQLPEQLAAAGINGGAAESSLVRLNRAYGSQRADIDREYGQAYRELLAQQAADAADAAEKAAQNRIDYMGAESALQAKLAKLQTVQQTEARQTPQPKTVNGAVQRPYGAADDSAAVAEKKKLRPARSGSGLTGHTALIR